ncbi:MAG: VCBS repeat-containing protein [Candidatus Cloacimonetes bacterium]|nr:VCBS repeat-containing protein [Candidatus Cloacimonadota bacterium]
MKRNIIIVFLFLFVKLYADYSQLPGFPYNDILDTQFGIDRGPGVLNINDDSYLEIVVSIYNRTYALNYIGELLWTAYTPREAQQTMSFADVTNDGYLEIIQTTRNGWIYILDRDGNNINGWPNHFGSYNYISRILTTAVAYDLDSDGNKEILWGSCDYSNPCGLYVVTLYGDYFSDNYPFYIDGGVACPPAIGDVDNDGITEIVCAALDHNLYVLKPNGTIMNGWPQLAYNGDANYERVAPVLADITGDGYLEIIVPASDDYGTPDKTGLYVYKYDGSVMPGWPNNFPDIGTCPPTVADINNDGNLEILCSCLNTSGTEKTIFIYNVDGTNFSNSPYYTLGGVYGPIIVGNIDSTPEKEIIFDSNLAESGTPLVGYLKGIHYNGEEIDNFPLRPYGFTTSNSGIFGDVNLDGNLDITVLSNDMNIDSIWIYAYDLEVPYDPLQIEWKTYQYDFQRLGQYHPPYSFDPPINFNASVDSHGVNLTWEQPANERNYAYSIFRDDELLARSPYTSFCDSLVQSYTTYPYYIKSVYEQGFSPPSEVIEITTDSISVDNEIPIIISFSAYPNPFSTSTTLSFSLTTNEHKLSQINIYNIKGQLVRTLPISSFPNPSLGMQELVWDGKDGSGNDVKSGVYFYKIDNDDEHIGKVVKLR